MDSVIWQVFSFISDKPNIDKSPALAKSASDKGQIGKVVCRATGAPDINFMWSRSGRVIQVKKPETEAEPEADEAEIKDNKYEVKTEMIDRWIILFYLLV